MAMGACRVGGGALCTLGVLMSAGRSGGVPISPDGTAGPARHLVCQKAHLSPLLHLPEKKNPQGILPVLGSLPLADKALANNSLVASDQPSGTKVPHLALGST